MCRKFCLSILLILSSGMSLIQAQVYSMHGVGIAKELEKVKRQINQMVVESVIFDAQESEESFRKIQRKGMLVRRPDPLGTVVICHGYLSNKHDALHFKQLFPHHNVFAFDFRAHGENVDGQISTIGRDEAFDVIGAVQFVKSDEDMSKKPVIVYGFSMGAVAAIEAQAKDNSLFDAMILDCPYDSTDEGLRRGLEGKLKFSLLGREFNIPGKEFIMSKLYSDNWRPFIRVLFKMITSLDSNKVKTKFVRVQPVESIKCIKAPCFFIHCENDKKVPVKAVQNLYTNAPGFKRLWITRGRKHFGSYLEQPEMYWYKVNRFLQKVFDGNMHKRRMSNICDERTVVTSHNA